MTIKKLSQLSQHHALIKLGRGSYGKVANTAYTLQPLATQNSIQFIAAATCKSYKTT